MRVPVQFPQYHLLQRLHLFQCVCFSVLEEKKLAMYMLTSGVSILFLSLCEPFNSITLSTDSSFCQLVLTSCVTRPIFFFLTQFYFGSLQSFLFPYSLSSSLQLYKYFLVFSWLLPWNCVSLYIEGMFYYYIKISHPTFFMFSSISLTCVL